MADHGNIDTSDSGDLNADARRYATSQGWAMDDGGYPIRPADNHGRADLEKAIHAVGRGSGSHDAIRKHIMKRASAIGLSELIPEDWNSDGSLSESNDLVLGTERRYTPGLVEVRATDDHPARIGGYGAVFGRFSRDLGGFVETVDSRAFESSRTAGWPDVVARYNHDSNLILGSTAGGTLSLRTDADGLLYEVEPPPSRADVLELVTRGDISHSSFAFRVRSDDWGTTADHQPHRVLSDVELVDVAPVAHPAYPDATAGLRSLARFKDASLDEVRAYAARGELARMLERSDRHAPKRPETMFGPSAASGLNGQKNHRAPDAWSSGAAASQAERKEDAMSELAQRLQEQRGRVWQEMKVLADRASEEGRNFTEEEQSEWDTQAEKLNAADERISDEADREKRHAESMATFAKYAPDEATERARTRERDPNAEIRAFFRGQGPRVLDVQPDQIGTRAALNTGTGTAGGDLVPQSFYSRLVEHMIENASIMQAGVTVINSSGGEPIDIPKTTSHPTAEIVSEGSAITESEPEFGQVTLNAYKYGSLQQVTRELIDDNAFDIESYLARRVGQALGNAFGAHAIGGTGSSQPRGVTQDTTAGVTGDVTADNLITLFYSVIAPYRASSSCHWMMADSTVAAVRKLTDDAGQYIFAPSMVAGTPSTLMGKPLLTDPNVADPAASAQSILFGDFSVYFVRLAGGVRFERSDEYAFNKDVVTFRALMRADGAMVDTTGAIKSLTGSST